MRATLLLLIAVPAGAQPALKAPPPVPASAKALLERAETAAALAPWAGSPEDASAAAAASQARLAGEPAPVAAPAGHAEPGVYARREFAPPTPAFAFTMRQEAPAFAQAKPYKPGPLIKGPILGKTATYGVLAAVGAAFGGFLFGWLGALAGAAAGALVAFLFLKAGSSFQLNV